MKNPIDCKHYDKFYFHENASAYCPDCGAYVDGNVITIFPRDILEERRKKIDKILTKN